MPELELLACLDRGDLIFIDTGPTDGVGVEHANLVLSDGPHGQLGLERHPELA